MPQYAACLCLQTQRFIEHELHVCLQGVRLLLAVSGGADSLALLTILYVLRGRMGHIIHVVHIDHGLRPYSAHEGDVVYNVCTTWDIPCSRHTIDVQAYAQQHKIGIEQAGREMRYTLLENTRQSLHADWICTGHHGGDLQEDIVLRFLRGTGWPALGGMTAVDAHRHLLRPLLFTEPGTLKKLLHICGLTWTEDPSNADIYFKRNHIRHNIMPLLRAQSPALHNHAHNLWKIAQADAQHWHNTLHQLMTAYAHEVTPHHVYYSAELLKNADKAARLRLYMHALHTLNKGQGRGTTLFALDDAWEKGTGGKVFQFSCGVTATLRQRSVVFV